MLLDPSISKWIGVMPGITGCLARKAVSVFILSTYDTGYVLVREYPVHDDWPMSSRNSG